MCQPGRQDPGEVGGADKGYRACLSAVINNTPKSSPLGAHRLFKLSRSLQLIVRGARHWHRFEGREAGQDRGPFAIPSAHPSTQRYPWLRALPALLPQQFLRPRPPIRRTQFSDERGCRAQDWAGSRLITPADRAQLFAEIETKPVAVWAAIGPPRCPGISIGLSAEPRQRGRADIKQVHESKPSQHQNSQGREVQDARAGLTNSTRLGYCTATDRDACSNTLDGRAPDHADCCETYKRKRRGGKRQKGTKPHCNFSLASPLLCFHPIPSHVVHPFFYLAFS